MDLGRGQRLTVKEALTRIPTPEGKRFVTLFEHGTLQVELYATPPRVCARIMILD